MHFTRLLKKNVVPANQFAAKFEHLTGRTPFPWQEALYQRFERGEIPAHCDLPTGLGKTSAIAVWLIALANHPDRMPRRLVYVVNRRTVVDQTTAEVEILRNNLQKAGLEEPLQKLCALPCDRPLAVSTLRGAFADNREWSADPCRPAVIVGTVDLVGSRLLFSGYRAGYKTRPLFAGFLGQDALLVHDEAHLEPAFQTLLTAIEEEQRRDPVSPERDARPVRVMQLSATTRGDAPPDFTLTPEDEAHPEVGRRLRAKKTLRLHALNDPKGLPEKLAELALAHKDSGAAVIIFARLIETVEKVAARVEAAKGVAGVSVLTGTMRGKERDELLEKPEVRRFLPGGEVLEGTAYLVCTSAGEVGVNLSADHLVCDLTTYESMAQRFGRVNRFGLREDTVVDVVSPAAFDEPDSPEARTLALLEKLGGDANPAALRTLDPAARAAAFSAPPEVRKTSSILFDAWAMTSVTGPLPGRPAVEPYLHGESENEAPATQVAWREEVGVVTRPGGSYLPPFKQEDLADLLADYPLKPHELLRDRSSRVLEALTRLVKRRPDAVEFPVWLVDEEGEVAVYSLADLTDKNKNHRQKIGGRTLLLPPSAGGLRAGLLDGDAEGIADDVADEWRNDQGAARRHRVWSEYGGPLPSMRLIRRIEFPSPTEQAGDNEEDSPARTLYWWWYERADGADGEGSASNSAPVALAVHNADVEGHARAFAQKLGLPPSLAEAVELAGRCHDLGKHRPGWQRSIGNFCEGLWLAKSGGRTGKRDVASTYRHEFGSVLDLARTAAFQALPEEMQDVALHLVAAHHGRARPHFPHEETEDRKHPRAEAAALAAETPRRFARLQRRYGRWGLAFLESLLRAADYAASAHPSATLPDKGQP